MDFFEHQEQAKRKTGRLVLLFTLAVAFLIAGLYFVVRGVMIYVLGLNPYAHLEFEKSANPGTGVLHWELLWRWDPETFMWVTLFTLAIVVFGSMYKIVQLQTGGAAVATSLGGRLIARSTKNPQERQVLNVVDEMAIASGITSPPVYFLDDEPGINAFAAGFAPKDAVIGVTRGTVELLSRQELQGVIAHEFSHIFNGDMRLNIQITGFIHGILVIGLIGQTLLRMTYGGNRHRYGTRRDGKATLVLFAIGAAVMAIGYLGVFFGNMIKGAVSRQREFLADASAVQFTRYPAGITGALKKIGGFAEGSVMLNPQSMTISHMFFSQGLVGGLNNLLATHPPLLERIRRIEPRFSGRFPLVKLPERESAAQPIAGMTAAAVAPALAPAPPPLPPATPAAAATRVMTQALPDPIALIGNPTAAHLDYAHSLLESLAAPVREAAHDPYGARALVYALLLSGDPEVRNAQLSKLEDKADPAVYQEISRLQASMATLTPARRLPLLDMIVPTLAQLSPQQYRVFRNNVRAMIHADREVELFEWMLQQVLLRHLDPKFRRMKKPTVQYYSLKRLGEPCSMLLSALAYQAHHSDGQAAQAFRDGAPHLGIENLSLQPRKLCGLPVVGHALTTLAQCSPREKRKLLRACAACILADEEVTVEEAELLRAVADALDCPMPPLLAGQAVAASEDPAVRSSQPAARSHQTMSA